MATWLVFVDDSVQRGRRLGMGRLLALGAVAFRAENVRSWTTAVTAGLSAMGAPLDAEIKWSTERGNYYRGDGAPILSDVRRLLIDEAAKAQVRAVAVVWDEGRTTLKGAAAEAKIFDLLWERINMLVGNPGDEGVVIFDKPSGDHRDEARWIDERRVIDQTGTEYVRPGALCLSPLTAPSHLHLPLQLADLVAGAVTAAVAGNNFGQDLMPRISPLLHSSASGRISGAGLKLFPQEVSNLYAVLLREPELPRKNVSIPLPVRIWPYSEEALAAINNL